MLEKQYFHSVIVKMAEMIAITFGKNCEVIVRDLSSCEIVAIFNGHVSGREVGHKIPDKMCNYLRNMNHTHDEMFIHPTNSFHNDHMTKSSALIIPDMNGQPIYEICINFDIDDLIKAKDAIETINELIGTKSFDFQESIPLMEDTSSQSINEYNMQLICAITNKFRKPFSKNDRESKLNLLRELDQKGVFHVRDSVGIVCDMLDISQATLYNYLREIKESK